MKKISLLAMLAFAGFGMVSCSDDDNNDSNSETRIEGTYDLVEVNTEESTDFDDDGDAHANQMEESDCYDDGRIVLNDDNTFSYTITRILVDVQENTAGCAQSYTATGTYDIESGSGTNAIITLNYEDQGGDNVSLTLTKMGNELVWEDNGLLSVYPDRTDEGGYTLTPGSTQYVYRK